MNVVIGTLAVHYLDEGEGPVVLMFHGWKNDARSFDPLMPYLRGYRVIRPDLPGFGGSELPKDAWDVGQYVQFVRAFIDKLGVTVHTLIGHSLGGRVILKGTGVAELSPRRIVLIAAAGVTPRRTIRLLLIRTIAKIGKSVMAIPPLRSLRGKFRRKVYDRIGNDYHLAGPLTTTYGNVVREDLSRYAEKITVPTLLVWGERDSATPMSDGRRLAQLIRGSQLAVYPGCGHHVHQERPEEVGTKIREFISA